jgi:hypothetical protein
MLDDKDRIFVRIFKIIFMMACLIWVPIRSHADQPPSFSSFSVNSANKEYTAQITETLPGSSAYRLTVLKGEKIYWDVPYDYNGYPAGMLSDDGEVFVYINWWYEPGNLIQIHTKNGLIKKLSEKDIEFDHEKVRNTDSHQIWLSESGRIESMEIRSGVHGKEYFANFVTIDEKPQNILVHSEPENPSHAQ